MTSDRASFLESAKLKKLRQSRSRAVLWTILGAGGFVSLCGCWYSGGEALYMLGLGRGQKVEAQFRLTDGPILILVDDPAQRIDWPMAKRYLADELAQELIKKKAAQRVIPPKTLARLRQVEQDFDRRGCREVGRLAGAEQVLWIETQNYLARPQVETPDEAAFFSVTVKVIASGESQSAPRPRLWPISPRGETVAVALSGNDVLRLKTKDAIARELALKLAEQIARFFYDHRLGDFDSSK